VIPAKETGLSIPAGAAGLGPPPPYVFARAAPSRLDWRTMEPDAADDAELLAAHGAGDPHAFARLYDRYDRPCFRFIRRMLGPGAGRPGWADAAEDLHQETWISVSRNAGAFDPQRASFRAWLFTIARNKVWDHFRRQKVAILAPGGEEAAMSAPDPGPSPLDAVEARQLAERLVAAVEALPLEQRGAFVMFADAGLSLEEIAEATGVPVETAKSRLRYARARLRQALASERSGHV
jgi:RNA polymerase sigma factor (sigma-70 family)